MGNQNSSSEDDAFDAFSAFSKSNVERTNFSGIITKLTPTHGIVSDWIYFDVTGRNCSLKVGASVEGIAFRNDPSEGWRAETVFPTKYDWDGSISEVPNENDNISKIMLIRDNIGELQNGLCFKVSEIKFGFQLYEGDWVQYLVENGDAVAVRPLRIIDVETVINSIGKDYGRLKGDIYFTRGVCHNWTPKIGYKVRVLAVESDFNKCRYRAVRISLPDRLSEHACLSVEHIFQDKCDVRIEGSCDFGVVGVDDVVKTLLNICNEGLTSVSLAQVSSRKRDPIFVFDEKCSAPQVISAGQSLPIIVSCISNHIGMIEEVITFDFQSFRIARLFCVDVTSPNENAIDHKPYRHRRKKKLLHYREILPGQKPITPRNGLRMKSYTIPNFVWMRLQDNSSDQLFISSTVRPDTYLSHFHTLLYLEEGEQTLRMRSYDLELTTLGIKGEYLTLELPGLLEKRPSIVVGDRVVLSDPDGISDMHYEGFIHEVARSTLFLEFHSSFHSSYHYQSYSVAFYFNRTPFRRCHYAVDIAPALGSEILFPELVGLSPHQVSLLNKVQLDPTKIDPPVSPSHCDPLPNNPMPPNMMYEGNILFNASLNEKQREAVKRIVQGVSKPLPHLIFGPPGTGKTCTLVECVLQVHKHIAGSRSLVVTPSNSSADLVVTRLLSHCKEIKDDLVRLNSYQRSLSVFSDDGVLEVSVNSADLVPAVRKRVIVTTCLTAGLLYGCQLSVNHFSHIFVDEAGQATEPETLIPLGLVCGSQACQIVLCGDPNQLGPVLYSSHASRRGLEASLLHRLSQDPLYTRDPQYRDHGGYNPLLITKLIDNYRSHPDILKLYSAMFYDDELVHMTKDEVKSLECWSNLPCPGYPVMFHGIETREFQEEDSPSWYNPGEVYQVVKYAKLLQDDGVSGKDIGIISPYHLQVKKIVSMLTSMVISGIKVGSVEEFQGQERSVIIISTVRSGKNKLDHDMKYSLGFLRNWRRLNVAISRAKALLIVIGSPSLLYVDPHWRLLLTLIASNGGYTGCELPQNNWESEQEGNSLSLA